jgi:hypothetical protein
VPPELKKKTVEGLKPKPNELVCLFLDSFTVWARCVLMSV